MITQRINYSFYRQIRDVMTGRLAGRVDILFEQKNAFKGICGQLSECEAERPKRIDIKS